MRSPIAVDFENFEDTTSSNKHLPNEDKLKPIPVLLSGGSGCKGCKFLS